MKKLSQEEKLILHFFIPNYSQLTYDGDPSPVFKLTLPKFKSLIGEIII